MPNGKRACIGILMLNTSFERVPGDIGNPRTWDFDVRYKIIDDASATRVIDEEAAGLLDAFIAGGRELAEEGCHAITTTCGFLALYQRKLASALPVPVATSSLLQVPFVQRLLQPDRRVGVLTMDASRLTARHLASVGVHDPLPMEGLPRTCAFWRMIRDNSAEDPALLQQDVLEAGERLLRRESNIGALVLECTNMPPYAAALSDRFGLPVFDVVTMIDWLAQSLAPKPFCQRA